MKKALTVGEALESVLRVAPALPPEDVPYLEAVGRILQEEVRADADYPPFDKSLMDGYAVIAADVAAAPRRLRVLEEIAAGSDPARLRPLQPACASRIMTGAPLPPASDAVLIVEDSEPVPGDPGAVLAKVAVRSGDNVARRGGDARRGEVLLNRGDLLGPAEIGVLAACGRTRARVGRRPSLAVLATGDELVEPDRSPSPGRIRNSNGPLLLALARQAGATVRDLGIVGDRREALAAAIERGLEGDILALSGGVSMGAYDLVGETLRSLGVEILFDRVAIKPGRPFTFGTRDRTLVFGCPGNPVSTYVIFQVFGRPAIRKMIGFAEPSPAPVRGILRGAVRQRPGRTGYYQTRARLSEGGCVAEILPTSGSADFVSCARGNALAVVPAEVASMQSGDAIDILLLEDFADR